MVTAAWCCCAMLLRTSCPRQADCNTTAASRSCCILQLQAVQVAAGLSGNLLDINNSADHSRVVEAMLQET
jgi:hypothetical protein